MTDKTFLKITNREIYDGIQDLKKAMQEFKEMNAKQHEEMVGHQKETNGKVRLNRWIATTALTMMTALIGIVIAVASGG